MKRIFDQLLDEHAAAGISYRMVRANVALRRKEIRWGRRRSAPVSSRQPAPCIGDGAVRTDGDLSSARHRVRQLEPRAEK
ncbi:hypothetical protein ACFVUB_27810 [Streptomyces niveus]|uniref:hypothetical protein n=1 Tax=Streptomyces niveus TaxID=193462 RepID=UPI0036DDAD0E